VSLWGSEWFGRLSFDAQRDFGPGLILDFNFVAVLVTTPVEQFHHRIMDLIGIGKCVNFESIDEAAHLDASSHHVKDFKASPGRLSFLRVHRL